MQLDLSICRNKVQIKPTALWIVGGTHLCNNSESMNSHGRHLSVWSGVYNGQTPLPSGHSRALLWLTQDSLSSRKELRDTLNIRGDRVYKNDFMHGPCQGSKTHTEFIRSICQAYH